MQNNKSIVFRSGLLGMLSDAMLLVDSTALIDAFRSETFMDFMTRAVDEGCALVTIPSVLYEFKRGAKDLMQLEKMNKIIKMLDIRQSTTRKRWTDFYCYI